MELMGRPPGHVKESLNTVVMKMGAEKGVSLIDQKYHDPIPVEGTKELYTTFAEIDVEFDSMEFLFAILMGFMPSNIEIYEPNKFKLNASELNSICNYLVSKLHGIDELAKRALIEKDFLLKQLQRLQAEGKIKEIVQATDVTKESAKKKGKTKKNSRKSKKTSSK